MNETDRTSVALLFHENIIDVLEKYKKELVIPFYIEINELIRAQKSEERIFDINVGSKKRSVLFKSVQYHPVTDEIIHIDLYGIKMDQTVTVNVNLELTGTAKGVTEGGIVVQTLNELEIECLPMDIPKVIQLDVSELEIGQNLKVENIILDEKITAISNVEQIVVSVTQAMKEEELTPQQLVEEKLNILYHNPYSYKTSEEASDVLINIGLSGTHQMSDGTWMPGSSHGAYLKAMGKNRISSKPKVQVASRSSTY